MAGQPMWVLFIASNMFSLIFKSIYYKETHLTHHNFQVGVWVWDPLCCDHLSGGDITGEEEEESQEEERRGGTCSCCRRSVWSFDDWSGWSFGHLKKYSPFFGDAQNYITLRGAKNGTDKQTEWSIEPFLEETVKIPTAWISKTKYHAHCETATNQPENYLIEKPENASFKSHQYCSLSFIFRLYVINSSSAITSHVWLASRLAEVRKQMVLRCYNSTLRWEIWQT